MLITYLGKSDLKVAFLAEIGKHEQQDAFIQGTYSRMNGHFRGCAVGCSLESLNVLNRTPTAPHDAHDRYEAELGVPTWLAYLEDNIFESLPIEQAKTWPRQFADAIPVGVTIPDVLMAKILRWTLGDTTYGCRHAAKDVEVVAVVDRMIALFDREIAGDSPTPSEWNDAGEAARAARAARAALAAWDAWDAWDARDARDARDAWAAWAALAALAAWDAWDAWAARDARDARDAFYPALSAYVIAELRALDPTKDTATC